MIMSVCEGLLIIVPNSGGGLWWFAVVCGGLRWFVVVCGGLWWFVVDCGGLSFSHTPYTSYVGGNHNAN